MLTMDGCRRRLERLGSLMDERRIDLGLITNPKHVYYFSGFLPSWLARAALVVRQQDTILICGTEPEETAAAEVRAYPANAIGTIRLDQAATVAGMLKDVVKGAGRVGTDLSSCDGHLRALLPAEPVDLDADLLQMRRRKDPDELMLLAKAVECVDACYRYAADAIEPGLSELDLYAQLYRVAVETAGEPIGRFGNDFQCATPGGPPRSRRAEAGELWILDIGVEYRGYNADLSRVFAVSGEVSDEQVRAWEELTRALEYVEQSVKPGASCRALFESIKGQLDDYMPGSFFHHLGHGIGLYPHEFPHLNPHWDDAFEEGDVFTAEPGLYAKDLRGGLRLENDYLVTSDGVQQLNKTTLKMV